jgi:Family of unknown function (DUF6502)
MSSAIQDRVLSATGACLRPMARVLLRCGISYRQFADMAKEAFIVEALSERDSRGRKANVSRVAVRTGISRKEVARLRDLDKRGALSGEIERVGLAHYSGHAARVLQVWHSDSRFVGESGEPNDLPYSGESDTFVSLVKIAGGDVPPGAVKAELLAAGAVLELESGVLKVLKRHFVPGSVDEKLVFGLTHILFPVLEGMARNTSGVAKEPWVQRLAYSRRLLPSALPLFRHIARERCGDFVQSVDDWLVSHESERVADCGPVMSVGVGVFYFEETELVQTPSETQATES